MRRFTAPLPAKQNFIPTTRSSGKVLGTVTPKKQGNESPKESGPAKNEKGDPIVAFSKPPPLPPVLGPLVALSLMEICSDRDGDDD